MFRMDVSGESVPPSATFVPVRLIFVLVLDEVQLTVKC